MGFEDDMISLYYYMTCLTQVSFNVIHFILVHFSNNYTHDLIFRIRLHIDIYASVRYYVNLLKGHGGLITLLTKISLLEHHYFDVQEMLCDEEFNL